MAILKNSGLTGQIESLLIHRHKDGDITSDPVQSVGVTFAGIDGESHSGLIRESCSRVKAQYVEGTVIRNTRQVSIVSVEELSEIARLMDIQHIEPSWLGANLCVAGIPDLTQLPPSSRLIFDGGVSLVVDMENEPCVFPSKVIEQHYPEKGKLFVKQALGRRGVTAWVEKEGVLSNNENVAVHIPQQPRYQHGSA